MIIINCVNACYCSTDDSGFVRRNASKLRERLELYIRDSSICLNYHAVCLMNISDRERIHLTQQRQHIENWTTQRCFKKAIDSETLTCIRFVSCWSYILKLHTTELIFEKPVLFYSEKSRYRSLLLSIQDLKISFVDRGGRFWCKQTICQFFNINGWCFQESFWAGLFERGLTSI